MNENTQKELSQNNNIYKINDTYTILFNKKIGGGAFGKIYTCINNKTKEICACKIEKPDIENPQLNNEYRILSLLKNYDYFPKCYKYCNSQYGYILILERLGSNLGVIMSKLPNKKYSMKSALMIINQSLERLKLIHEKGIIHRDMKPENLCIGYKGKEKNIYLIDFGLSKLINNDKKNQCFLLNIKKEKIVIGTVRYISMNAHLGNEQYKKDDLESLAYMMIYFIKGELPWQNLKAKSRKEKYTKIYQKKKHTVNSELCNFLPDEIKTFLNYVLNLNQKQNPDYVKLTNLINNLMKKYGYTNDSQFEWYSSSFLQKLYNSPVIDEGDLIKSSSIYEEDDSVKSEKNKIRDKNKKNNNNINHNENNIQRFSNFLNNMNDFEIIYNKNITSTKNIKQKIVLQPNKINQNNQFNNITNAIDNYVNNEIIKKRRRSSYG